MGGKLARAFTLEEVRDIFTKYKCELLTDGYTNRNDTLKFRCSCGNIDEIKFYLFLQGSRCSECSLENKSRAQRFDYNYVKEFFEINECELLEKEYKNTSQKMRYRCSCGNDSVITFRKFRAGQRCFECSGTEKLTLEEVKKRFSKYGYELLEKEYINSKTKMKCLCKCGRESYCSLNNLKRHGGCVFCRSKKVPASKQQKYISEIIKGEFNYPYDELTLDIAFPDRKIYVECDFSGHWLSVQFGQISLENFIEREARRRKFMNAQGWREVRLISRKDWLIDEDELKRLLKRTMDMSEYYEMNLAIDIDESKVFELDSNIRIIGIDSKGRWRL